MLLRAKQIEARQDRIAANVVNVVTKYEGAADDDHILDALEKKYNSLKDKLLLESLISQIGTDKWMILATKDKQQRLVQLKFELKKFLREGRYDDAAEILGMFVYYNKVQYRLFIGWNIKQKTLKLLQQ